MVTVNFSRPVQVDFQGEGKKNGVHTSFYTVNDQVVTIDQLHELIKQNRDASWHFGFDSLRIFLQDVGG